MLNHNKLGRVTSLRAPHGHTHDHPFLTFNTLKRHPRLVFWHRDPTSHSQLFAEASIVLPASWTASTIIHVLIGAYHHSASLPLR